jgi:hypothetical protein
MAKLLESLCVKMTLTKGEKLGITITEDETTGLCMKSGRCLIGKLMSNKPYQEGSFPPTDGPGMEDHGQCDVQGVTRKPLAY